MTRKRKSKLGSTLPGFVLRLCGIEPIEVVPSYPGDRGRIAKFLLLAALAIFTSATAATFRDRPASDEIVYFVLPDRFENGDTANDRGGLEGDRLRHGFDPGSKGFYHGGDLKGLTTRLDYIQALGATAIWLTPVFKNKPVQGRSGAESAAYHGYWITDFTRVDPHLGDEPDLRAFIAAAHERDMKVYFDIIVNHTADVIAYRECTTAQCPYRSRADYPYSRHLGLSGDAINAGFAGDDATHQTADNFAKLTRPDYAYTPYLARGEENIKIPAWLNEPRFYHNRGNTTFEGESATFGDFDGLDDLMTENPRVLQGFIDIFGGWIDRYRIDGYRIDTAKHVNVEFWQAFAPAMLARARANGIPNFHLFGEVSTSLIEPALLARYTRVAKLPAVLDFAFASAVRATVADEGGTDLLARLFADDNLYEGGEATALQLPTFVSNHDIGRFAWFVRQAHPNASDDEVLRRVTLAHAMLFTLRGVPVVYYGDEQGFAGLGGDQDARQDMFPSRTESYRLEKTVGTSPNAARSDRSGFDGRHPLFLAIADLAQLRQSHEALRHGRQIVRNYSGTPGLFAVSRIDSAASSPSVGEVVVAFNTGTTALTAAVEVDASSQHFSALRGTCPAAPTAPGSLRVTIAPLDFIICAANPLR